MSLLRRAGAGLTLALSWVAAASCAAVLGLDGFQNAAESLCAKLEACDPGKYPECRNHVRAGLEAASATAKSTWLTLLTTGGALDSCSQARLALDALPICHDPGSTCSQDAHCCGFTGLSAKCDTMSTSGASCCRNDGAKCSGDLECCGKLCADDGSGKKSCGGRKCAATDEACANDDDCCSMNCDDKVGKCVLSCLGEGATCTKASECCTQSCGSANKCACIPDGQSCASPLECCSKVCNDKGKCETPQKCVGFGHGCDASSVCCDKLACGSKQKCCVPNAGACANGGAALCCKGGCDAGVCCTPLESFCSGAKGECCKGSCLKQELLGLSECCNTPAACGASPCMTNQSPLAFACTNVPPFDPSACIKELCKDKPSCCCTAWSADCAQQALDRSKKVGSGCYLKCGVTPV